MTRSDLLFEVCKCRGELSSQAQPTEKDKQALISSMYNKIENAYKIVFMLEADKDFKPLGEELRKALES